MFLLSVFISGASLAIALLCFVLVPWAPDVKSAAWMAFLGLVASTGFMFIVFKSLPYVIDGLNIAITQKP